jgi:[protein-PII] uridylyltransferase
MERIKIRKPEDLLNQLFRDPSVLSQHRVRTMMDDFSFAPAVQGRMLKRILKPTIDDRTLQAIFRSRLIEKVCPRIIPLVGLVQHDQYHRFTADAHLLQACREVVKSQKHARSLGALRALHGQLTTRDWTLLGWTALYHDLAKGGSGDHSAVGEQWVEDDLKTFGYPENFRREVAWLVRHHLELSIAAFRKNPHSPQTWQDLLNLDLNPKRLLRLAVWTAIDIRATNPEAWTDWKGKLLLSLVEKIQAGGTQNYFKLKKQFPAGLAAQDLDALDPHLFEMFSAAKLSRDFLSVKAGGPAWALLRDSRKKLWVRYHRDQDQPGLLSEVLTRIYASGASIQHALVHTLPGLGVYDWFQVQTQKDAHRFLQLLQSLKVSGLEVPQVRFMSIEWVSQSEQEWVLSFRGQDQKGLLLAAASQLKALGAQIKSARVHTWGRQIEDLFHIVPLSKEAPKGSEEISQAFLQALRQNLV